MPSPCFYAPTFLTSIDQQRIGEPRDPKMLKRLAVFTFAGIAALMSSSVLRAAQTVPPTQSASETDTDKWKTEKWNTPSPPGSDRKSTRLNSSHRCISYAVFCLKKKTNK